MYELRPSAGWRWFPRTGWERVCHNHAGAAAIRRGDYVPDTAMTDRHS